MWNDYFKVLLALVVYREARGEGEDGMRAVAHVIANRVNATHLPDQWDDIITAKNQFTSISYAGDSQLIVWPRQPDIKFEAAMRIAESVFSGEDVDTTGGALYYANLQTIANDPNGWFTVNIVNNPAGHPKTTQIGHHTFFR